VALSFAPVARAAQPAVVNVFTAKLVQDRVPLSPFQSIFAGQPRVENSLGSGVIVDPAGRIVTSAHVVRGASQIIVALSDRREYPARIVHSDPRLDLALLEISPGGARLPALALGDSDAAQVGDLVLAIGNPFGIGQTVTQGIVSAVARSGVGVSDSRYFIQTDAAINQGNSGGALVDLNGRLVGINTQILTAGRDGGSIGIGFAIPSNMVRLFLRAAETGRLSTAWLGASGTALTQAEASAQGLDAPSGVAVSRVAPGSPAARAGVRPGDVLVALNGQPIQDPGGLAYRLATTEAPAQARLAIRRDGQPMQLDLSLVPPPETPPRDTRTLAGNPALLGTVVANLSPALAQELGTDPAAEGVIVLSLAADAPARLFRFPLPGDRILALNGRPVRSVDELVRQLAPGPLLLRLDRGGQVQDCLVEGRSRWGCRPVVPA
jgi:serine protease Do